MANFCGAVALLFGIVLIIANFIIISGEECQLVDQHHKVKRDTSIENAASQNATIQNTSSKNETPSTEMDIFDDFDVPYSDTEEYIKKNQMTIPQMDFHDYYKSMIVQDQIKADKYFQLFKKIEVNNLLSKSYRRATTIQLPFDFPFYGHPVRNITIASGGFIYTGEFIHSWLAKTQYIAPLMGNFDTNLSEESFVRHEENETSFTAFWENVSLQDKPSIGKFSFSATLHKTGDIVFMYFLMPIDIRTIQDDVHPIRVGLSDAYILQKKIILTHRKMLYEYHRVSLPDEGIKNNTIIYLNALPTCLSFANCTSCLEYEGNFICKWCPALNKCSSGTDRNKQDWINNKCDVTFLPNNKLCPEVLLKNKLTTPATTDKTETISTEPIMVQESTTKLIIKQETTTEKPMQSSTTQTSDDPNPMKWSDEKDNDSTAIKNILHDVPLNKNGESSDDKNGNIGVTLAFIVPISIILFMLAIWVLYAYRNPQTKSGQLLIQYRPTQWRWRRGEARYTAATIHMLLN